MLAVLAEAQQPTPFSYQLYNSDRTPQTNMFTMQGWPPSSQSVIVVGTNIIFSDPNQLITNIPNSSGFGTNLVWANTYRVFFPASGLAYLVNIPVTASNLPLSAYVSNAPAIYTPASFYAFLTNGLGCVPVGSNYNAVASALGFTPATNGAALTYSLLPFTPPSNNYAGITNAAGFVLATNGGSVAYSQLPYVAATNSYAGLTNVLGFKPATNITFSLTGAYGYTNQAGQRATFYITNGIVITNTIP